MGYGVAAYRFNSQKLRNILCSSDEDIQAKVIKIGMSKHCQDITFVKEMVEEGKAANRDFGHEYFYALEGVIAQIGVFMPSRHWYPVSIDSFGKLAADFKDLNNLLPFSIPEPDDFPWVIGLANTSITEDLMKKLKVELADDDLFLEMKEWLDSAKASNQDLILYLY